MKKFSLIVVFGLLAGMTAVFVGCDWESTEDGFNTSKGAGALINFSGVYRARSGGYLVASNITQLVLNQSGNTVEVWDNNNSYYRGSVGSPGVLSSQDSVTGVYPAGATMVQSQLNFNGLNEVTGNNVSFIGIIHAVAITDVQGTTTQTLVSNGQTNSQTFNLSAPPITTGSSTVSNNQNQVTTSVQYQITENNTQYLLDGNWVEEHGIQASVTGIAPAVAGTFN